MRLSFLLLLAIILIAAGNAIAYGLGLVGMPQVLAYVAAQIFGALVLALLLKASDPAANAYDDTADTDMADAFTPAKETQQASHQRVMHAPLQPPQAGRRIPNPAHGAPRPPGHRPVGMGPVAHPDDDPNRFGGARFPIGSGLHSEAL